MSLLESLTIAVRSLGVNKLRSALTALGIIVGVAAVVCMISIGAGAQADVAEKIRALGANLLVVMPSAQSAGGARLEAGTQATLTAETWLTHIETAQHPVPLRIDDTSEEPITAEQADKGGNCVDQRRGPQGFGGINRSKPVEGD